MTASLGMRSMEPLMPSCAWPTSRSSLNGVHAQPSLPFAVVICTALSLKNQRWVMPFRWLEMAGSAIFAATSTNMRSVIKDSVLNLLMLAIEHEQIGKAPDKDLLCLGYPWSYDYADFGFDLSISWRCYALQMPMSRRSMGCALPLTVCSA